LQRAVAKGAAVTCDIIVTIQGHHHKP
jgi:hypothetical protein